MVESVFTELSIIIIIAVLVSWLMRTLRQPIIIGHIITGILAGPLVFNVVKSTDVVATLSQFGIVFLLFIAGLSLNPKVLKGVGKVSIITGLGQILFTTAVGFLIARMLGFPDITSLYIAIALTFSSTIIIIKLLSDKGDLQTLYGRISVGFLLVQDVVAIMILMIVSSSASGYGIFSITLEKMLSGIGMLSMLAVISVFALPKIVKILSKSQEFLLFFSIGWMLLLAVAFEYIGLSIEIGALVAGIALSVSPHHYEIKLKMNVLRDFFILFFFILLGSQMVFINANELIIPIIAFSVFILVGNPLIVMALMGLLKYTKRNSFLAGLTVAQISEFSMILIALGVKIGHIEGNILSLVTGVGLFTIFGSSYMITHAERIYQRISGYLSIFEKKGKKIDEHKYQKDDVYDVIVFGYNRIGLSIIETIKGLKKKFLIVDYNPEIIAEIAGSGYDCRYGDADDSEFLDELNFQAAKMVISTIPDAETNLLLIRKIRERNKEAIVIIVSHQIEEALRMYESGATYVVMPYFLGGEYASTLIQKCGMNLEEFFKEKAKHINHLKRRKEMKHEHPRAEKNR
ncbi:MAG: cation:proton antiporter [Candidatus Aenigmarchaeota archaeon]|nr:cation:proton antiporter [Candidatus Aenigmarchaeota archaeon]